MKDCITKEEEPRSLSDRLQLIHVGVRGDLEVHRHVFQDQPSYVLRDPVTLQCHRLSCNEYQILCQLRDDRPLGEAFAGLVEQGKLKAEEESDFYQFILSLHRFAILKLPISSEKMLYRRYQARQKSRQREKLMSFFFLRIPLFNPDSFLNKTLLLGRALFSRWAMFGWLGLFLVSIFIVSFKKEELFGGLGGILTGENLFIMWFLLIGLKVFHEFGHAYACKIHGGHVPEMGVFLIALTPCAYVDVTSSWGFSRKRHRLMVGLAGVYIETYLAMLSLLVWSLTTSSTIGALAGQVFFLASILTLLMNANPLMRFDGYYVLGDLLEIPNLRQHGQRAALNGLKRVFLGLGPERAAHQPVRSWVLMAFGVASTIYKSTIILSISALVATRYFLVGLVMAGGYILMTLTVLSRKLLFYLWKSPETEPVRIRAIAVGIALFTLFPLALLCVPVPGQVYTSGQLIAEQEEVIRAGMDGFVQEVNTLAGQYVGPESRLVKLENTRIEQQYLETKAKLQSEQIKLQAYKNQSAAAFLMSQQRDHIQSLKAELQHQGKECERLDHQAHLSGLLIEGLEPQDKGRFLSKGQPIGTVISGRWLVTVLLTEQEFVEAQPHEGQRVGFRFIQLPDEKFYGTVHRIAPAGSNALTAPALTALGEGAIPVNMITRKTAKEYYEITFLLEDQEDRRLCYGMTGRVQLGTSAKPLGLTLWRSLLRFVNKLHQG